MGGTLGGHDLVRGAQPLRSSSSIDTGDARRLRHARHTNRPRGLGALADRRAKLSLVGWESVVVGRSCVTRVNLFTMTAEPAPQRVLYGADEIAARVGELARLIEADYGDTPVVLLCVLRGSFIFVADLARALRIPARIEFFGVRSYGSSTESSGVVQITQDLREPISGLHVIVVEDIVDTGLTSKYILEQLRAREPASLRLCSLLHKPSRSRAAVDIDYLGFTIEDHFVVGYGLDKDQQFRNLPDLRIVDA